MMPPSETRPKILIVDDKPANLFSLEQILKVTGAELIQVASGNEALIASLNHDFILALLDVQMPEMDGFELAELLRSEEKTKELPIIFVSAVYSSDYHVFKGYEAGAVDFLVKPYEPRILLSKVKVFIDLDRQKRQLEASRQLLSEANTSLEDEVKERTAELEKAILELQGEIEKRKEAEEEIRRAKREWQEIFEAIGNMTMILDREHRIIAANRATLEQTGLSLEEITGRKCYTVFHNSDKLVSQCPMAGMMQGPELKITEAEVKALGKSYIVSCTPVFDERGELEKIIHIATDITKIKQLKKELVQAHKMEAIGSLAGGIAHDFNNILSAVLGFTELSLRGAENNPALEEDLRQVYTAGLRARDLVRQILNFARKTDEEPQLLRIDLIAKEVVQFLRSTIPASIEIKKQIYSKSLVMANPVKIHQLIMNLCSNAAYAMNETGTLRVSVEDVDLVKADLPQFLKMEPGKYLRLQVEDTGCGIPAEMLEMIFEPFFTTKATGEGTGMGLAMVHNVVKECGGDISVKSEVGKGTTFTVILPVTGAAERTATLPERREIQAGSGNILVVDDERPICTLVSRTLAGYGYTVTVETESEKALAVFAKQPKAFDLVITDMTMPKMTGDLLAREILAIRPDIPVVIATGYSKRISEKTAFELGAKALLIKPIEKDKLLETIRNILRKSSPPATVSTEGASGQGGSAGEHDGR